MPDRLNELESLVRTAPDPTGDRDLLLELRDPASAVAQRLAEHLRTDEACRSLPLRELLPGLSLIDAPNFSIRLDLRAANPLLRVGAGSLKALAPRTPDELRQVPLIGEKAAREILAVTLSEWAGAYLGEDENHHQPNPQQPEDISSRQYLRRLPEAFDDIEEATGFEAF